MDTTERLKGILVPLSTRETANVMHMFSGLLESLQADAEDGSDGPIRAQIQALVIGYQAGRR